MKIILRIGYRDFLIPASVNVNAIVAAFSKATALKSERVNDRYIYVPDRQDDTKVSILMVEDDQVIDPAKVKRKALPEVASPDANNTF